MQIARQSTWSREVADLFHYRTGDGVEVDLLPENRRGQVVAIEVRALRPCAPTISAGLDRGLNTDADS